MRELLLLHEWSVHHCQLLEERLTLARSVVYHLVCPQVIGERVSRVSTPTMISDHHLHHSHCVDTLHSYITPLLSDFSNGQH